MENFTPIASLLGGILIGLSASALLLLNGRIAGVSGIVGGLLRPVREDILWRGLFLTGLLSGGLVLKALNPGAFYMGVDRSFGALVLAGLLVGFGTRLGSGCTSGHGVCGMSRGSKRSLVATATFMGTGALVVYIINHVGGES